MPSQPESLRIAWLVYRGNPYCGGQGVYTRYLANELTQLGHRITVFSGQPYPELVDPDQLEQVPSMDLYRPENPFRDDLARYNTVLAGHGLPEVPVHGYAPGFTGDVEPIAAFDYDSLHFLRRAYLLGVTGFQITPVDELGSDYEQLLEMFESTAEQSHLVWHFDHAGAYVPVEFPVPLVDDELLATGGPLGSSYGLLRELHQDLRILTRGHAAGEDGLVA